MRGSIVPTRQTMRLLRSRNCRRRRVRFRQRLIGVAEPFRISVAMDSSISSDSGAIARLGALVEVALRDQVDAAIGTEADLVPLAQALRYPIDAGGKRLRPILLLATVEALGGDVARALSSACALELIHTFSLVHDDLPALDNDDLRRGKPTTHVAFGEDVAVLVGDGLMALAFRLIIEDASVPASVRLVVAGALARATDRMVRGQYLDLHPVEQPDEVLLRRMCGLKTGCLLEAAIEMGLALVGAEDDVAAAYRALALEVGVGFQMVDDVLDVTATTDVLGKTAGADEANGRQTWVRVLGLEQAQERVEQSWATTLALLDDLSGEPQALRAIVELVYQRRR